MPDRTYAISYPRRRVQRAVVRAVGRALVSTLTRTEVTGRERFPLGGPLVVVGNHIAAVEVVLMVVHAPWQIELLGPGDVPPPPVMHAIARLYGYTPIHRGSPDRAALGKALDVLEQGGVVGIFPEGGIWDTGPRPAKRGVAWLSHRAGAPVLPIGFGGLEGALRDALRLKRPRLSMNVGTPLPAVTLEAGRPRKLGLRAAAARVMQAVQDLIPGTGRGERPQIVGERFELEVTARDAGHVQVAIPPDLSIVHGAALSELFYRPAILNILGRDLGLPVGALQHLEHAPDAAHIAAAARHALRYLRDDNPAFLTYRFGQAEGTAMQRGLQELEALASWAAASGHALRVTPVRRYRRFDGGQEVVERAPGQVHVW
jgi:1-acyl-sn-glycerol-3-phosphate acyltransferase